MPSLQVYRASAGSGKTYQLALKYISLLLGYREGNSYKLFRADGLQRHREILAITFTNKATQEMRRRIVDELAKLANPSAKCDYRRDIHLMVDPTDTEMRNADIDRQISLAAARALYSMLFDLGEMQISTIDAFFQRVLRSFAYEADLAGNYELMLENDRMTDMAISDLLAHACGMKGVVVPKKLNSQYLRQQVKQLIDNQARLGREYKVFSPDSNLRAEMVTFIKHLADEDYLNKKDDIEAFLGNPNAITNLTRALEARRKAELEALPSIVDCINGCEAAEKLSANAAKFLALAGAGDADNLSGVYLKHLLLNRNYAAFLNKNTFSDAVINDFAAAMDRLADVLRRVKSIDAMLANMRFLGLFREILIVRQELKAHLNTILLSDTNELLNLIIDNSDAPFIYERIGRRIHHFLIDEFQDTSRMQWNNLRPLLSESLSSGNDNLIIGDVKQCIYRFRNSSPELLATDLDRTPQISAYIDHCALADNWRSAPIVVNFNNALFEAVGKRADVAAPKGDAYNFVFQNAKCAKIDGYVNVALIDNKEKEESFNRMIDNIVRQLNSGYTPGDIVVLVRTNSDACECVNVLLEAERSGRLPKGTMIVSDEALYVSSARSVKWIINRLHEMNGMEEQYAPVNSRGLRRATSEDLDWMREHLLTARAQGNTDAALEQVIAEFNAYRNDNKANSSKRLVHANGQSIIELVEQLVRELPDKNLAASEVQYLCALQDLVVDYCSRKAPTLQGFLKLWDEELADKAAVGLAEGVNAIRVMTIHKSKGLEFNCVHLPLIKKTLDRDTNCRWYDVADFMAELQLGVDTPRYFPLSPGSDDKGTSLRYTAFADAQKELKDDQTIDEINALYVAFTRARQELIVTIIDPRSKTEKSKKDSQLPLNHPSGLLCPIIARMAGNEAGPWSFGAPTVKYVNTNKKEENIPNIHPINKYVTRKRKEMWSQTRAASKADTGEII